MNLCRYALVAASLLVAARTSADQALPARGRHVCQSVGDGAGLATQTVVSLVQDGHGFLWIGTMDGVFRYDGKALERFGPEHGLASTLCIQLAVDAAGGVWAAMRGGLARFDGQRFVAVPVPVPQDEAIRATPRAQQMALGPDGSVYVTTSVGLWRLPGMPDALPRRVWTTAHGLPSDDVDAVYLAKNGQLWLSAGGVIAILDPSSGDISLPFGRVAISSDPIQSLHVTRSGTVWVRGQHHLWSAASKAERLVDSGATLPPASFLFGMPGLDRADQYLLPTSSGLFYESDGAWQRLGVAEGLPASMVLSAFEDHEGALWLGLGGSGLVRCPGLRAWRGWTVEEGLPDSVVWSVARDALGRLWVGTGAGIALWSPGQERWTAITTGLAGNNITKVVIDERGWAWFIAARLGIGRVDPVSLAVESIELPAVCREPPVSLQPMSRSEVWAGGVDCLLSLRSIEDRVEIAAAPRPAHTRGCTRTMAMAPDHVLWTGGPDGLCRFDGTTWDHYFSAADERHLRVDGLAATSGREVWITNRDFHGLTRVSLSGDEVRSRDYFAADGLPSDAVYLVGRDADGRIFAGGNAGVAVLEGGRVTRTLNHSDGLIWDDVSGEAFLGDPDGKVLIGTSRGLSAYDRRSDLDQDAPPMVVARTILAGGTKASTDNRPSIVLQPERASLAVELSCLTFRQPEAARFSFRLRGLEHEETVSALSSARYPTLPPGTYEFNARCISAAGVSSSESITFPVVVLPPWWQTPWTLLGAIALLTLLVVGLIRRRTRRLLVVQRRLERAVAERSEALEAANLALQSKNRELEELSFTDVLTQTKNRRYFSSVIDDDVRRAARRHAARTSPADDAANRDLVVFIIDLDHFKRVNDSFGHLIGDRLLVQVASRLAQVRRESDLLVRWGGEEFLLVLRDTDRSFAPQMAQRVLHAVGGAPYDLGIEQPLLRSCSVGFAAFPFAPRAPGALSVDQVIALADRGLYLAKARGRNRAIGVEILHENAPAGELLAMLEEPLAFAEDKLIRCLEVLGPVGPRTSAP